jgi:ribonucleoside-diphosphate reductase alpha chain
MQSFPKRETFPNYFYEKLSESNYFLYLCTLNKYIIRCMEEDIRKETLKRVARELAVAGQKQQAPLREEQIVALLEQKLMTVIPEVTEVRPQVLECDVVRFQNNKEKWVALVGLLDGYPYEIFTGLQDDEEGIMLPKTVTHGKIIKQVNPDGTKRYDFQFENKRGYKTTVEGLSEKFNPEYWNYAKLISGVLRYRMPLEHVIKLVGSLSLKDESINTWKTGVERALKKYIPGNDEEVKSEE